MIAGQDGQILDLIPTDTATVCTIVTDERSVAEEEEVRIGVEDGVACIATKAVYVPSIARWKPISISVSTSDSHHCCRTYQVRRPFLPQRSVDDRRR